MPDLSKHDYTNMSFPEVVNLLEQRDRSLDEARKTIDELTSRRSDLKGQIDNLKRELTRTSLLSKDLAVALITATKNLGKVLDANS